MPTRKKRAAAAVRKASFTPMGPLELAAYKSDWKASRAYLRHIEEVASRRGLEVAAQAAQEEIMKSAGTKRARRRRRRRQVVPPRIRRFAQVHSRQRRRRRRAG